ncbi:hypothetical protein [Streptomyces sp. 8P21H-1]|uniref:hypothetical protein n=1 Tax=Streptomyces sp. 8P21H-1 TaxID=2737048 RepID=UPI00156F85EF|nr:hypothetical protein [Streptomyces sp. 8P21H-1]NSL43516.1 hypothetical protein [Streptomyces sp. 8P21H-1]
MALAVAVALVDSAVFAVAGSVVFADIGIADAGIPAIAADSRRGTREGPSAATCRLRPYGPTCRRIASHH